MSDADAREVVARIVYGIEQHGFSVEAGVPWVDSETLESIAAEISASDMADSDFNPYWREADAILAALADAGYAVVRKSQILVDAFGQPESIEEVRPGVTMYTWPAEDDE